MEEQKQEQIPQYINKDMTVGDVVQKYPEVGHILTEYGLHCVGCHGVLKQAPQKPAEFPRGHQDGIHVNVLAQGVPWSLDYSIYFAFIRALLNSSSKIS